MYNFPSAYSMPSKSPSSLNLSLLGALSGRDLSLRGLSQNALNQRDALGQSNKNRQS